MEMRRKSEEAYMNGWNDAVEAIVNKTRAAQQWIPCSVALPNTRTHISAPVLCCKENGEIYAATFNNYGEWHEDNFSEELLNVIAWMPLPEPYKEGE